MKIYLVGGAIRDSLLNLPVKDKDWVVVGGTKEILIQKKFQQVGKDFPVFLHPKTHEEYALARKERKFGMGHSGFTTDFNIKVTLKEDLIRRDLTINAIAQDKSGKYIDPFKGRKDLKNRILRHVSKSFVEDPLRIFRTARFAASLIHLGFQIAKETMILMKSMVKDKELSYLSPNRIWIETKKAFKTLNPHVYFQVLYSCNALCYVFPEIYLLYEKNIFFPLDILHNSFSVFCMGLSKIAILNQDIEIRFSFLCQFIFKKNIFFSIEKFYDQYSAFLVKNLCNRFNVPSYIKDIAVLSAGFYIFLKNIYYRSSNDIVAFFLKIDAWRKPYRVKQLSFLNNFNYIDQNKDFKYKKNFFLQQSFKKIKNISVRLILKKGFKGDAIKNELNKLRVKKLNLWRKINKNI